MQKIVLCSHFFWPSICRTTTAVAFSSSVPFRQHFRLFCSKVPVNADDSETKRRQINETQEASGSSAGVDPFGWEPTKRERFFLVLMRCYAKSDDIPAIIPYGQMRNTYGNRMRILRFFTALMCAIIICFGFELYIANWDKRRRSGKLSKEDIEFVEKMRKTVS